MLKKGLPEKEAKPEEVERRITWRNKLVEEQKSLPRAGARCDRRGLEGNHRAPRREGVAPGMFWNQGLALSDVAAGHMVYSFENT